MRCTAGIAVIKARLMNENADNCETKRKVWRGRLLRQVIESIDHIHILRLL